MLVYPGYPFFITVTKWIFGPRQNAYLLIDRNHGKNLNRETPVVVNVAALLLSQRCKAFANGQ